MRIRQKVRNVPNSRISHYLLHDVYFLSLNSINFLEKKPGQRPTVKERDVTEPGSGNDQLLMVLRTKCQDLKDLNSRRAVKFSS